MKIVLGCLMHLVYFVLFAGVLFGAVMGNHCAGGPCLSDHDWRVRILVIFIGGFAIWFGALFCYWWFVERRAKDE